MSSPRSLARLIPPLVANGLKGKSQAFGALLSEWDTVMGQDFAARAIPLRLSFPPGRHHHAATLHLKVAGTAALDVQHAQTQILERINSFFGYHAVDRLRLVQGVIPTRQLGRQEKPPDLNRLSALRDRLATVEDVLLKDCLDALAQVIAAECQQET